MRNWKCLIGQLIVVATSGPNPKAASRIETTEAAPPHADQRSIVDVVAKALAVRATISPYELRQTMRQRPVRSLQAH